MADFNFSVLTPVPGAGADSSALTRVLDSALSATGEEDRWKVTGDGFWSYLVRPGQARRSQGWKLHVSATPASAEAVLARSLPVLLRGQSPFKFARTIDHVALLNARHTPRGHSGKFITVYPHTDEEAVQAAEALHLATLGHAGPRILSDQPYAPMSLVHYRYGAFVEERRVSNDGFYAWTILDPDGNPVEDRRVGQYLPPSWVRCPFPPAGGNESSRMTKKDDGVLVGDRFLAREAIRHSNKGGVYRAVDTHSGGDVVIKEARAHVAANEMGQDARDLLRVEARALRRIESLGVAPRLVALFEQSQHLFLVEDLVPGVPLRESVPEMLRHAGWGRHVADALDLAGRLVELMDVVHQAGLILRDFSPNNIMVLPDGQLRLIDLELAVAAGEPEAKGLMVGTPGYGAPEQMAGAPPSLHADYFSLGATMCFLFLGDTPYFLDEVPTGRSLRERLTEWLAVRGEILDTPRDIQMLILGLMDEVPEHRSTLADARHVLAVARKASEPSARARIARRNVESLAIKLGEDQWQQAVNAMVTYLLASLNPADEERLWPVSCGYGAPDPCSLQLGAPGILGTLTRYFELTGDQQVAEAIATAGRWIAARAPVDAKRPAGLYFGNAGIAWSLFDAGQVLGDARLAEQGLALAVALPARSASPDVMQGTAGIGLTFLHLWLRTGNIEYAQRAGQSADTLIASVSEEAGRLVWVPPAEFDSRLAGRRHYGFAHGTAGVGYFLLAAALATGRSDCLQLACRAGESLLANATVAHGVAHWGAGPGDVPTAPYWCHGAAGIGSFLTRLHRVTGDDRFGKAALMSAQAVIENSWRGSLGQCHGLAGNGEFLIDMAQSSDGARHESSAHQLARVILTTRTRRDDQMVFPNEHGGYSATWGDGISGILSFFLRLWHRCPRLWMVDALFDRSELP